MGGFFRKDEVGDKIELVKGQELKLVTDYTFLGDSTCIAVSYPKLPTSVKPGGIILCADGSLSLSVKEGGEDYVICEVLNSVKLGKRRTSRIWLNLESRRELTLLPRPSCNQQMM